MDVTAFSNVRPKRGGASSPRFRRVLPLLSVEVAVGALPEPVVVREELRGPDGGHRRALVPDVPPRHVLHRLRGDGVDPREELRARDPPAVRQELPPDLLRDRARGALGVQQERGLERLLRPRHVLGLGVVDEPAQLAHDAVRRVVQMLLRVRGDVHAEQTGVGVVGVERHERVGEVVRGEALRERRNGTSV